MRQRQKGLGETDMSDLTDYDRKIVEAAEAWIHSDGDTGTSISS